MSKSRALVCLSLLTTLLSSLGFAATPDRILGPITSGASVALRGGVHRKALPQYDQGSVPPSLTFGSVTLHTTPTAAQQRALKQLLADQQNPRSANYHKWLTPEQWADRFGLSQNDIQRISSWLASEGFTIRYVARGRNWITVSGTAAQVEKTFGVEIHYFNVDGELHVANAASPKIPSALTGIVTNIRGLDDFHLRPRAHVRPRYFDASFQTQFVAPGDIATIYDINPLYSAIPTAIDGTGQKLAIIGQTDIYLSDLNDFRNGFGLAPISSCSTNTNGVITATACNDAHFKYLVASNLSDPGVPLTTGDLSEADVDIETAGAVARNAQIVFVNAPATFDKQGGIVSGGVWAAWQWAVDNVTTTGAYVMSMSYGTCEFGDNAILDPNTGAAGADEVELQKANSEGITFVNSTGDSGAAECDPTAGGTDPNGSSATQGIAVGYPASSPEVTGVGGTATPLADFSATYWNSPNPNPTDGTSAIAYVPEQAWNDDEELAEFCSQNTTNQFCTQGGSSAVSGWKPVTSAQIMQEDLALMGSGISAGGGGASNCAQQDSAFSTCVAGFPQPTWQPVTISGQSSARFSPDVSFLASPNFPGYIFCTELSELGQSGTGSSCASGIQNSVDTYNSLIGGTSVSAPLFAGIVTLMNQYLGTTTGSGNVNPALYQIAVTPSTGAFNAVTAGDNNVYCTASTPSTQPWSLQCPVAGVMGFSGSSADAATSYNLATGLGSVDANNLAVAWKALATQPGFTLSPSTGSLTATVGATSNTSTITANPVNGFSGSVTFACSGGLPSGATCQFSTSTPTVLSIKTSANTPNTQNASVIVTGTSGAVSSSTVVALTVTGGSQSFTLESNLGANGTLAVTQGSTGTVNLGIYSTDGFVTTSGGSSQTALAVSYACTGLPTAATCNFSPGSPTQSPSVTLSIVTTLPTAKLEPFEQRTHIFYATLFPGLIGLILLGSRRQSIRGMKLLAMIMVLGFSTIWLASCGGSNSSTSGGSPGTPKGSYPIKVNATTSNAAMSSSVSFTLQVN